MKDLFGMFLHSLGIKFSDEEKQLVRCPACGNEHKWSKAGEYCRMTCYFEVNGP